MSRDINDLSNLDNFDLSPPKPYSSKNRVKSFFAFSGFIAICSIFVVLAIGIGSPDSLSLKNILYVLSKNDLTYLFKDDIQAFKNLYSEMQALEYVAKDPSLWDEILTTLKQLGVGFQYLFVILKLLVDFIINAVATIVTLFQILLQIIGGVF